MLGTVWPFSTRETYQRFRPVRCSISPWERALCSRMARKRSAMTILFLLISRYESFNQLIRIPPREAGLPQAKKANATASEGHRCKRESFEFAAGSGLMGANAAGGDGSFEIVFTQGRRVGEARKQGDLARVLDGLRDRAPGEPSLSTLTRCP